MAPHSFRSHSFIPSPFLFPFRFPSISAYAELIGVHEVVLHLGIDEFETPLVLDIANIGSNDIILGLPWLRQFNPIIDWTAESISFRNTGLRYREPSRKYSASSGGIYSISLVGHGGVRLQQYGVELYRNDPLYGKLWVQSGIQCADCSVLYSHRWKCCSGP